MSEDEDVLVISSEESASEGDYDSDSGDEFVPKGKKGTGANGTSNGKGKGKGKANGNTGKGRARGGKENRSSTDGDVKVATKAEVLSLATDAPPGGRTGNSLTGVDEAVLQRIKKALSLGTHEGTGEAEAKAAMRLASKLMAQHNVNQADVLASEDEEQKLKRAGQSTVAVRSLTGAGVLMHAWSTVVAQAVEKFFDCKSYSMSMGERVDWTFYGLAEQTVAAAYAFEMVYNLILTWSAQNKTAKGRTQKNNYCYGVADGLYELARKDRKEEERRAIQKEKERLALAAKADAEEREREIERLKHRDEEDTKVKVEEVKDEDEKVKPEDEPDEASTVVNDEEPYSDAEDFAGPVNDWDEMGEPGDDFQADFDAEEEDIDGMLRDLDATGHINVKHDPDPVPKSEPKKEEESKPAVVKLEEEDDTPWQSGQQLTLFRHNAASIADDYLRKQKIKLHKLPRVNGPNFSRGGYSNYNQGKEDAKKIDVKRKRIRGVGED
ncbi:hypothetical protein DACRYDRAFT_20001 [Dacryopinax primogenitus]|uniref:Uncharacterized protein n=1 Tax=Dacryopinax primogenitus (strain DJM 731) TaxID=1858805 RepID=M5GEN0_DACPD|nr:uncharacterized protein DACRYDRAFT_20001 [Dacryopinax primogenitus]EJU05552.1 hypothetical protein DACRYDRAFT_20001 [Dacryopinax primogenitus]